MVPDQGYYGEDKRRRVEIYPLIPAQPPPPPPPPYPGIVHPPHIGVGGDTQGTYSYNSNYNYNCNRRGERGGRIRYVGRGEGGRRGRGDQRGRGTNRGGITDEQRLKGYYLPSFVENLFGPLLHSQLQQVKSPPKVDTPVEVVGTADEMLPTVQQEPNAVAVPENNS